MNQPSEFFKNTFSIKTDAKTDEKYIYETKGTRFSVITSNILRIEKGNFCDEPTQSVLFRNFVHPVPVFKENGSVVTISTDKVVFVYNTRSNKLISVTMKNGKRITEFKEGNLKGTARTLDMINGSCPLGQGLVSLNGVTIFDDSTTCIINDDGTISERKKCSDKYVLAFGRDYRECTKQMQQLCGQIPLIPRYCLGNWWSRYKAYTQKEYTDLMDKFIEKEIPITVATIDMDWHWVNVVEKFGKESMYKPNGTPIDKFVQKFQNHGWTGYSWNTDLFPDYRAMLKKLNDDGMKVTVNLHPAQGVRFFEDQYKDMAEAMGIDPQTKEAVKFDIADPKFIENYFKILHYPFEDEGVAFWWIDWQQEKTTKIKGLDPLWALNHYHTLAFNRSGNRPLILSRFAEIGSHRYPLGFSGDTFMTWDSLDFQPYFTITAANVNYSWWSHDIGGHQFGAKDDELYARWVQFGEYSPIMRLHSTSDEFMGKEPWKYSFVAETIATNALRERHAMLPYLYTMNRRTHKDGLALCEPIYYTYPEKEEAYKIKNEYMFGTELLVVPVTTKMNKIDNYASTEVWLPKGRWVNIYTDRVYEGEGFITSKDDINTMPVFAKEGAILPLQCDDRTNNCKNPVDMKIRVWSGNNKFSMYEDDGETMQFENGVFAQTCFVNSFKSGNMKFTVKPATGDLSVLPEKRNYSVVLEDVAAYGEITVTVNGKPCKKSAVSKKFGKTIVTVCDVKPKDEVVIDVTAVERKTNPTEKEQYINDVSRLQMKTVDKKVKYTSALKNMKD